MRNAEFSLLTSSISRERLSKDATGQPARIEETIVERAGAILLSLLWS